MKGNKHRMRHPKLDAIDALITAEAVDRVVAQLDGYGSHALGFCATGTPEDRAASSWLAGELRAAGLTDVIEEELPVDAWRLTDAWVQTAEGERFQGASFGGVPGTGPEGIRGRLVVCEGGDPHALDGVDLTGAVVLYDWQDRMLLPATVALELGRRGAVAIALACLQGGPYYQEPGALGSNDGLWHHDAPPMVTLRREDARKLAATAPGEATVMLAATMEQATATNVVGVLRGRTDAAPIVLGGHHDAWFYGSMDDASGVAMAVVLAQALAGAGVVPERSIVFVSHTAEEFGLADSAYDWCWGAWWQVAVAHREWAGTVPFYLNLEGSGTPDPLVLDTPPDLRRWVRRVCRAAEREGLLPYGWSLGRPNSWTEVWPFLVSGVPGINVSTFHMPFARTKYHTQYDDRSTIDMEHLARLTKLFARMVLSADALGETIVDHGDRAADLRRSLGDHATPRLNAALDSLAAAGSDRDRHTAMARGVYGLDDDAAGYAHEAVAAQVRRLEQALAALAADDRRKALRALEGGSSAHVAKFVSHEVHVRELARRAPDHPRLAWARQSPPAPDADLWEELATLRGADGARAFGPWIAERLERVLADARAELARRLERMAAAVEGEIGELVQEPLASNWS